MSSERLRVKAYLKLRSNFFPKSLSNSREGLKLISLLTKSNALLIKLIALFLKSIALGLKSIALLTKSNALLLKLIFWVYYLKYTSIMCFLY